MARNFLLFHISASVSDGKGSRVRTWWILWSSTSNLIKNKYYHLVLVNFWCIGHTRSKNSVLLGSKAGKSAKNKPPQPTNLSVTTISRTKMRYLKSSKFKKEKRKQVREEKKKKNMIILIERFLCNYRHFFMFSKHYWNIH